MNASDLLTRRANLTPDREGLYDLTSGVRYTYSQLNERASRAGNFLRDGKVTRLDVKVGEGVLFGKYAGSEIKLDGEEHLILREDDILGVLEG